MCNYNPRSLVRSQSNYEIVNTVPLNSRCFLINTSEKSVPNDEELPQIISESVNEKFSVLKEKVVFKKQTKILDKVRKWHGFLVFFCIVAVIGYHGYKICQSSL